ncbi:MAG: nitroreductase family deazaflavin-dependent oxidoreductase [Chloroflexi bacterium]|nr:MAG: nitroreductase family deazaflavin-dependent oxidoreductase [Chloroflexota bacterium]
MNDFDRTLIEDFRAHRGHASSGPFVGRDLMLLTTTGARTNEERTTPLVYTRDGNRYVIIASKSGAPTHPAWYLNILAHPEVRIEVGTEAFRARATVAHGAERRRLYNHHAGKNPSFWDYERRTNREIPVITVERIAD